MAIKILLLFLIVRSLLINVPKPVAILPYLGTIVSVYQPVRPAIAEFLHSHWLMVVHLAARPRDKHHTKDEIILFSR